MVALYYEQREFRSVVLVNRLICFRAHTGAPTWQRSAGRENGRDWYHDQSPPRAEKQNHKKHDILKSQWPSTCNERHYRKYFSEFSLNPKPEFSSVSMQRWLLRKK